MYTRYKQVINKFTSTSEETKQMSPDINKLTSTSEEIKQMSPDINKLTSTSEDIKQMSPDINKLTRTSDIKQMTLRTNVTRYKQVDTYL